MMGKILSWATKTEQIEKANKISLIFFTLTKVLQIFIIQLLVADPTEDTMNGKKADILSNAMKQIAAHVC